MFDGQLLMQNKMRNQILPCRRHFRRDTVRIALATQCRHEVSSLQASHENRAIGTIRLVMAQELSEQGWERAFPLALHMYDGGTAIRRR